VPARLLFIWQFVADNETSNTNCNLDEAQAQITTCSAQIGISGNATRCSDGSTADFLDLESTFSPSHGQFYANAVTIKQNFSPFFSGTILGHAVMPFLRRKPIRIPYKV
jgi:hypothetical protein